MKLTTVDISILIALAYFCQTSNSKGETENVVKTCNWKGD